ncbi:hypothetical protein GCK72_008218 [Caenorhabditis remanei]|uniref:DNA2/NAM7 helicase-like C-terminal domain-containing protein n=1 Tax=Caenorhabditis remanei TaxID=31234 RepID=A0A6A5GZZ8_CAERE|nr:hypothetical protein GCK72_008218 [Caenorhabditis remanei]KAF1759973.1 hypothetical protein GCK72_008218 [Caenorhabditis remanei]
MDETPPKPSNVSPTPYGIFSGNHHPLRPVHHIAAQESLHDIELFRFTSLNSTSQTPTASRLRENPKTMLTIDKKPKESGVIYILHEHDGRQYWSTPLHREVVHPDRPDLQVAYLNPFATDILNGVNLHPNNYFPGDAVYVTEVAPKPNALNMLTTFEGVHDPKNHGYWSITRFYLIQREFIETLSIRTTPTRQGTTFCFAAGFDLPIWVNSKKYKESEITEPKGSKKKAVLFMPMLQPGQSIFGGEKCLALESSRIPPSVVKFKDSSPEEASTYPTGSSEFFHSILTSGYLAFCAILATQNRNGDFKVFATTVLSQEGGILMFDIRGPSGPLLPTRWPIGTNLIMETSANESYELQIVKSETIEMKLRVNASLVETNGETPNLTGSHVLVQQQPVDNIYEFNLEMFPAPDAFDRIPAHAPIKQLLEAIFGFGEAIPDQLIPRDPVEVLIEGIYPTCEQMNYINALVKTNIPVLLVDAPLGTGKTLMVCMALHVMVKENRGGIHVAMTTSGEALVAMVSMHMKIAKNTKIYGVRVVSDVNYRKMDQKLKTPIDFPVLWPQKLLEYVKFKIDQAIDELTKSAIYYLAEGKYLQGLKCRPPKPSLTLWETFLQIYQPRILVSTASDLISALQGPLLHFGGSIETIQVDNANQFPIHALLAIGPYCPNARYVFVGDSCQLEAYPEMEIRDEIKGFAIGQILKSAKVRSLSLSVIHRCPAKLAKLCLNYFYPHLDSTTFAKRQEDNQFSRAIGVSNDSPIQVVHVNGSEAKEAELTISMIQNLLLSFPQISIGVLAYQKTQQNLFTRINCRSNVHISTIESSQGMEFDVVFVLTSGATNDTKKDDSPRRINVAVSRTKGLCVLLIQKDLIETSMFWKGLLSHVSKNAFHNESRSHCY